MKKDIHHHHHHAKMDEFLAEAKAHGYELTDEQIDDIAGGFGNLNRGPNFRHLEEDEYPNIADTCPDCGTQGRMHPMANKLYFCAACATVFLIGPGQRFPIK